MQISRFKPLAILEDGRSMVLEGRLDRREAAGGWHHDFEVVNPTRQSLRIARVRLFDISLQTSKAELFTPGFYMPSDQACFLSLRAGQPAPRLRSWRPSWCDDHTGYSHSLVVVKTRTPRGGAHMLTAGFVSFDRFEGFFTLDTSGSKIRLAGWCSLENLTIPPGAACRLESILVLEDPDFNQALAAYADYTGSIRKARVPRVTATGWVDWQYYRQQKDEQDILRSASVLRRLKRRGYPFRYVIVDAGWCEHASEWLMPRARFPDMKRLCAEVRKAGLIPGLWLAPYVTSRHTEVVRLHPEWMVRDARTGRPLSLKRGNTGDSHVLDYTVPEALAWLRNIVRIMVRKWGVGYIKLDGPCLAHYRGGIFHNKQKTAVEQIVLSLRAIREACGPDVLVEGEGIYGPALGYVDIQRTQQDARTAWYNLATGASMMKANMQNDLLSAFLHGRWWHNHRENVVLRDFPSPFHPGIARCLDSKDSILTENQLLLQLSATALVGGPMLLSDPMEELERSPRRMELISRFLPHYEGQRPARPIDVFRDGRPPALYHVPVTRSFESWHVVGVFNWDETHADFDLPIAAIAGPGAWHVHDFWNEQYLGCYRGVGRLRDVPPHGCRVLALRRKRPHPQLVGTNLHILQGAVDIASASYSNRALRIEARPCNSRDARLFIWRPTACKRIRAYSRAGNCLLDARHRNLIVLHFDGRSSTPGPQKKVFTLRFA